MSTSTNLPVSRRVLLQGAAALAAAGAPSGARASATIPNVLVVVVERLPARLRPGLRTPALDRLTREGVLFSNAFANEPSAGPSRAVLWTGRMASETGAVLDGLGIDAEVSSLDQHLVRLGHYDVFHIGGVGPPGRRPAGTVLLGATGSGRSGDHAVVRSLEGFLRNQAPGLPWLAVVGLHTNRERDAWVQHHAESPSEPDLGLADREMPPLPEGFATRLAEANVFQEGRRTNRNLAHWSSRMWRQTLWMADRLVEGVDQLVGRIIELLDASIVGRNTLLVVVGDRGDSGGDHGLLGASSLYDGATRVPMWFRWPDVLPAGRDVPALVSTVDLAPTFCDFLGAPLLPQARGYSLRPLLEARAGGWRPFVVAETLVEGRMYRTAEFKLVRFRDDPVLQLFRLPSDPHELRNLADDTGYASVLADLSSQLDGWERGLLQSSRALEGWHAAARLVASTRGPR